jgi:hypothetical protein
MTNVSTGMTFLDVVLQTIDDPQNRNLPREIDMNGHSYYHDEMGTSKYDRPVFTNNIMYRAKDPDSGQVIFKVNNEGITEYSHQLFDGTWQDGFDVLGHTYYKDNKGIRFRIHKKGILEYELSESDGRCTYVLPDRWSYFYKCKKFQYRRNF